MHVSGCPISHLGCSHPGRVVGSSKGAVAPPLAKGSLIGRARNFVTGRLASRYNNVFTGGQIVSGPWVINKSGYLGFEFTFGGKTHFGCAHLNVTTFPVEGFISEFAYDSVPGQSIQAGQTSAIPEPGTLSLLALGAAGLAVLRKRKLASEHPSGITQRLGR